MGPSDPGESSPSQPTSPSLLVMRIQCLSAIIYVSTILNPCEKSYDTYELFFRQIVDGAFRLLGQTPDSCFWAGPATRFRLISPLSQPLYLTSMKGRHGRVRREAIGLLSMTGREGPWDSVTHVQVARRALEIEEHAIQGIDMNLDEISVPEKSRLHGCGLNSEQGRYKGGGSIEATFSRCFDVDKMMLRADILWDNKKNWDIWTEKVPLPPINVPAVLKFS